LARLLLTFTVGIIGGFAVGRLKVPAGYMVGSLIAVAVFNFTTGISYYPAGFRVYVQIVAGSLIGSGISRRDVFALRRMLWPSLLMIVYFLVYTLLVSFFMTRIGGLDTATALFASAPGGLTDMALVSLEYGANPALIIILQLVRLIGTVALYPIIFPLLERRGIIKPSRERISAQEKPGTDGVGGAGSGRGGAESVRGTLILIAAAAAGGMLLYRLRFPAGALVGGMLGSATANICLKDLRFESRIRPFIQAFSGAYIGTNLSRGDVLQMAQSVPTVLIMLVSIVTVPLVFGYIIHKLSSLELGTALFSAAPGGLMETALLADDMGMDVPKISLLHTLRLVISLALLPSLFRLIMPYF